MLSCGMRWARRVVFVALVAAASTGRAQQPTLNDTHTFRAGIDITGITVTVRDGDGRELSEDGPVPGPHRDPPSRSG